MIVKIETTRLLLRPPAFDDAAALVAALNNLNVTRMTGRIPFPYTSTDAVAFVENCMQSSDRWRLVIIDKATNTLLGGVGIIGEELGYWVAESNWGNGFASEAATAVVSDVFSRGGQEQVVARWRTDNPASGRVLEKLGFERRSDGICTSTATNDGHPLIETVLTKMQWFEIQKKAPSREPFHFIS